MSTIKDFLIEDGILKKYSGNNKEVVIPDEVKGIGNGAFSDRAGVKTVIIPDTVKSISDEAFQSCIELSEVNMGDGIETIGNGAFRSCAYLEKVTLSSGLKSIGKEAFANCYRLKNIIIPGTVIEIGKDFLDEMCDFDTEISDISVLPSPYRQKAVLCYAKSRKKQGDPRDKSYEKYIKSNAAKLVDTALSHPELLSIMCHDGLITPKNIDLYMNAAQECGNTEIISMMLDYIGNSAGSKQKKYEESREKKQEEILEKKISRQEKKGIDGLVLVVSGKLETFANKDEFKRFITERGGKLVSAISAKVDFLIMQNDENSEKRKKANELGIDIITEQEFNKMAGRCYWIEDHVLKKYFGEQEQIEIPKEVKKIDGDAFQNCKSIRSVTIPEGVKEIGSWAFSGCENLISISIPESVEIIGNKAFDKTPWFFSQPKGVILAGRVVIGYTGDEKDIIIPEETKSIGSCAFENCITLTEVSFQENVTMIGWEAFKGCTNLRNVRFSEGLTNIEGYAFQGCQSITELVLPEGVQTLGWCAFDSCINLSKVVIPRSVTKIGLGAFSGCKNLTIYTYKESAALTFALNNGISVNICEE